MIGVRGWVVYPSPLFKYTIMNHSLPRHVRILLEEWEYLGFKNLRESAEFVLANSDWHRLVKDFKFEVDHLITISIWRVEMLGHEARRSTYTPVSTCSSINLFESPSFGGKVSKQGTHD